jgi:Phage major capsid protein E
MPISLNQHRIGVTQTIVAKFSDSNTPKQGLSAFFPTQTTISKNISIEVERNLQTIAVDVQRATGPNRNVFTKSTEKIFVPPTYEESFDFTALERYDVTFAQGNAPTLMDAKMMVGAAMRKVEKLKNKVLRAIELQRSQVLQTGVVVLKNGDSIDFRRKAESMPVLAGAAKWDAPTTCDPFADLEAGMTFLREEGLSSGTMVNAVFGKKAYQNFVNCSKVKEQGQWRKINRIELDMPQFDGVTGMVFQGQVAAGDYLVNIWTYNEFYIDPNDGTKKKYIDENNVVLVSDDFEGITQFAGVPAILGDVNSGLYVGQLEGEFYVRDIIDQVKMTWDFILASAPLVVPVSIDRIYTIKTA